MMIRNRCAHCRAGCAYRVFILAAGIVIGLALAGAGTRPAHASGQSGDSPPTARSSLAVKSALPASGQEFGRAWFTEENVKGTQGCLL